MQLADAYRLLELDARANEETIHRAWRDLTKVWHPDRFAHDPALRAKAQEKLKSINAAYEMIVAARAGGFLGETVKQPQERPMLPRLVMFALFCAVAGFFILLRRPTPSGLILSAVLFLFATFAVARIRRITRR